MNVSILQDEILALLGLKPFDGTNPKNLKKEKSGIFLKAVKVLKGVLDTRTSIYLSMQGSISVPITCAHLYKYVM